jgi:hypothetical protein
MKAAKVVDKDGDPKYALHAFRHFLRVDASTRRNAAGVNCPQGRPNNCSGTLQS